MEQTEKEFQKFIRNWILTFFDQTSYVIINMVLDQGSLIVYQDKEIQDSERNKARIDTYYGEKAHKYLQKFVLKKYQDRQNDVVRNVIDNLQIARIIEHQRINQNKELTPEEQEELQRQYEQQKKENKKAPTQKYIQKIGLDQNILKNIQLVLEQMISQTQDKVNLYSDNSYMCLQCNHKNPNIQEIENQRCNGCNSPLSNTKDEELNKKYSDFLDILNEFKRILDKLKEFEIPNKYLCSSCDHSNIDEQGNQSDKAYIFGFKSQNIKNFINTFENVGNTSLNFDNKDIIEVIKLEEKNIQEKRINNIKKSTNLEEQNKKLKIINDKYITVDVKQHENVQEMQTILKKRKEKLEQKQQQKQQGN